MYSDEFNLTESSTMIGSVAFCMDDPHAVQLIGLQVAVFSLLVRLMAQLVVGVRYIGISVCDVSMFSKFNETHLFKSSPKYSIHLLL